MTRTWKLAIGAVAAGVLAVGAGAGIAQAVSGGEAQVTGSAAQKAAAAALRAAGGGTVLEVERHDGDGAYEVEVRREDGSQVEIHLGARFEPLGSAADDDLGSESADDD